MKVFSRNSRRLLLKVVGVVVGIQVIGLMLGVNQGFLLQVGNFNQEIRTAGRSTSRSALATGWQHVITSVANASSNHSLSVVPVVTPSNRFVVHNSAPATEFVPQWQKKLLDKHDNDNNTNNNQKDSASLNKQPKYFLTEILKVRIYDHDKAKWTIKELKQWIHAMLYAGVEHIYLCDRFQNASEKLDVPLKRYIDLGLVSYYPQFAKVAGKARNAQVKCYQYILDNFKGNSTWQITIDMDEYPIVEHDFKEGYLARYMQKMAPETTELSLHNYIMLGQGDRTQDMAISRVNRVINKLANKLDKPIYRPTKVKAALHHMSIKKGKRQEANDTEVKMLHYWGSRTQNFGPDTEETLKTTHPYTLMADYIAPYIKQSLLTFGETDAFSNTTGP